MSHHSSRRDGRRGGRSLRAARTLLVVGATVAAASAGGEALAAPHASARVAHDVAVRPALSWGPVTTLWNHGPENVTSVTTNNGMVVAAWSGLSFNNLWISVRPAGQGWSQPTEVVGSAAGVTVAKAGKGAWVLWQGFADVSALQIGADGSIGTPEVIGSSSDPFISDASIAAGSDGAVAAVWHTHDGQPAQIAYRPAGGDWTQPESVPQLGGLDGLVVGSAGTAQLVLSKDNPDFRHQEISYLRRSPNGTWSAPFVVASKGTLATVAGNSNGDIVVGWETVNDNGSFSLAARYKAAESGFGATHQLEASVPEGSYVALAMAGDGRLSAAYQVSDSGSQQLQLTPADSTGLWLDPQTLPLTGGSYDIAMSATGNFVVTSELGKGVQLVTCTAADVCGGAETNLATGYKSPSVSIAQSGVVTLVWDRGCKHEACNPTSLVAQRGR